MSEREYWFRTKISFLGLPYGPVPVNRKGWVATVLAYLALILWIAYFLCFGSADRWLDMLPGILISSIYGVLVFVKREKGWRGVWGA